MIAPFIMMGGRKKAYVMIITGQSNAGSHGENLSAYFTIDATKVHHYDSVTESFIPYNSGNAAQNGWETQAAGLQSTLRGDCIIYVIRVAQGSLAISNWNSPSGSMWVALSDAITKGFAWLRSQGFKPVPLSTKFVQGEQDAVVGTPLATYQATEQNFVTNLQSLDETLLNTQYVTLKLTEGSGGGIYDPNGITYVNGAKTNLVAANSFAVLGTPEDIPAPLSGDFVHYSVPTGYMALGNWWSSVIN